jgi:DNA-directed RNA polymerase beta' subunit
MTAILSCLRSVPISPAGAEAPLKINRPSKEVVDTAREAVIADQEAVKVLKGEEQDGNLTSGTSTAVDDSLHVQGGDAIRNASIGSIRSAMQQRHNVGLRRAGEAPDGLQ